MALDKSVTPTTPTDFAPMQVEVADQFNLPSKSDVGVLEVRRLGAQSIDVQEIGGQPFNDVVIEVEGVNGSQALTDTAYVDASSLYTFGNPTVAGPLATTRFEWTVRNRSNNNYTETDPNNNPYKAYINYVLRQPSVAEKLKRGFSLNSNEQQLASKYGLDKIARNGLPIEIPDVIKPVMASKGVVENKEVAKTVSISNSGESNSVNVASEKNLESRDLVAYVNRVEVDTESFNFADKLVVQFIRSGVHDFYHLETRGMPGQSDNYSADLHLPFIDQMGINVFSSNPLNGVNVKLEYTLVERSIVEKALYNLENEVSNTSLYNDVKARLNAGVSLKGVLSNG